MIKQVLIIPRDLRMRRGKEVTQGAHAAMKFICERITDNLGKGVTVDELFNETELEWITRPFTKVCLQVPTSEELIELHQKALEAGLLCRLQDDDGKTEFRGVDTNTCLSIGPAEAEKIDAITGHLKIY